MHNSISRWVIGIFFLALAASAYADDKAGPGGGLMMGPEMMSGGGRYGMEQVFCRSYVPGMMRGRGSDQGFGMGHDMMRGFGMHARGGMFGFGMGSGMMAGAGMFHGLNLSDDQREKVTHLMDAQYKAMWKAMGDVIDARIKLRDLYAEDQPDPGKVGAAWSEIFKVRQKMIESEVRTRNEIMKLLTKEQLDRLHQWRDAGWRQGPRAGSATGQGMMRK